MFWKTLLTLTLLASPVSAQTISIETYRGPVEVTAHPDKIAVLDVAAMDDLAALGIVPDGVLQPIYVDYLSDVTSDVPSVGTLFEPDYEAIAALGPDLIIAGGRSYEAVPDLAKLAPTIDMTIWEDVIAQGLDRLNAYGQIFGKEAEAAALIEAFNAKLAETASLLEGEGDALIVMTVGPKISAYGAGGRFGWLHTALGLPEAVTDVESATHGEAISFEFIRDADPDILIVIDRLAAIGQDGALAQATLDNALVHETKAWQSGRVIYLDSAALYIANGGIQSMTRMLDAIAGTISGI